MRVQEYAVTVTYRDAEGRTREEAFPVRAYDHGTATEMALAYVLQVLGFEEFELRVVG